ncbi:MAG TPA: PQQ-binding-like beta-propeller repeat protein [Steroidobacteraceae bacterium]|nr:PQQ-binding-like beta-propeller repeat protein [Steroidobacteraceae bacterium]
MLQRIASRRRSAVVWVVLGASGTHAAGAADSSAPERRGTELGFAVFQQHCVSCHGNPAYQRAPSPTTLRTMSPERIYTALTTGLMKSVGDTLTEADRRRVAESLAGQFLGSKQAGDSASMPNHCSANPPLQPSPGSDWNGWGNDAANSRFQPAAAAGLTATTVPNLKLKWAFGFPGGTSAFAQPAVVGGRVFVGTDIGYVYSLDAATGCIYWSYRPDAGVRTAMTVGPIATHGKHRYAVFFGDLKANAYAIDAQTGAAIWKTHVEKNYATRVTAAPALYQGKLFVPISAWEGFQARVLDFPCCTATGSVSELDANTGRIIWKTYSIAQRPQRTHKNSLGVQQWAPAGVPIWNTPTVDPAHQAVYVGTGDASTYPAPPTTDAILALDMRTGKRLWTHQVYPGDSFIVGCAGAGKTENCPKVVGPDWDVPMSPMLKRLADGRTLIVFATKPGDILALDVSRRGATAWHIDRPATSRGGGAVWGGAMDESTVYVPGGRRGIAAFAIADGQRKWSVSPGGAGDEKVEYTAAVTAIPGVLFVGASDGGVWALSSTDGRALWSYQSAHAFTTVNAVAAHGGSIASAGATVAGGMLLVGSGYGVIAGTPGNVLLAFGVQ